MSGSMRLVAEKRNGAGEWVRVEGDFSEGPTPFSLYDPILFGFLGAHGRNRAGVPQIADPRHYPSDWPPQPPEKPWPAFFAWVDAYDLGDGVKSWLDTDELEQFDYDQTFVCRTWPWLDREITVRHALGPTFFHDLALLRKLGVERIVYRID